LQFRKIVPGIIVLALCLAGPAFAAPAASPEPSPSVEPSPSPAPPAASPEPSPSVEPSPSAEPSPSPAPPEIIPAGTVTVSATTYGFDPGSVFGPWQFQTLEWRSAPIGRDTPGLNITNRTDRDGGIVTNSLAFGVDDYHNWTDKFFTYAAVSVASGNILPRSSVYVEADPKVGDNWIFAFGYGLYNNPDGIVQDYLDIGPSFYFPGGDATVRYIPLWTRGQVGAPSYSANLELGQDGRSMTTFSWQGGVEPLFAVNDPSIANRFSNRTNVFDVDFKHWINQRFGYHVGVDYASQSDRTTGANVYTRRGLTAGLFFGIGSATVPTP
jgi:YaiO family outer membrane protein